MRRDTPPTPFLTVMVETTEANTMAMHRRLEEVTGEFSTDPVSGGMAVVATAVVASPFLVLG